MKGATSSDRSTKPTVLRAPEDNSNFSQKAIVRNGKRMEVSLPARAESSSRKLTTARVDELELKDSNPNKNKDPELPLIKVPPLPEVVRQDVPRLDNNKDEPAYKNIAPLEIPGLTDQILKRVLDAPLHATVGEILGLSDKMRKGIIKESSKIRKTNPPKVAQFATVEDVSESDEEEEEKVAPIEEPAKPKVIRVEQLPASTFTVLSQDTDIGPKGAIVVSDPVLQYYESTPVQQRQRPILAARDVENLRTIFPDINEVGAKESIIDPGSQVVSIPKLIATELALSWDPDITMGMEGCHGDVELTLGLARNVPFRIGDITLLLQVHIVNKAPYEVLLGRPFDVVGRTTVENDADGDQVLTVKEPSTGRKLTFPTFERGKAPPGTNQGRKVSFQASRS
jgi:hypothetical protein